MPRVQPYFAKDLPRLLVFLRFEAKIPFEDADQFWCTMTIRAFSSYCYSSNPGRKLVQDGVAKGERHPVLEAVMLLHLQCEPEGELDAGLLRQHFVSGGRLGVIWVSVCPRIVIPGFRIGCENGPRVI